MINWFEFIIFSLGTWRISTILVREDGPFDVFFKLRAMFDDKQIELFDLLFSCVWCMSVWVATFIILSAIMNKTLTLYLILPFALSAIAVILEEKING